MDKKNIFILFIILILFSDDIKDIIFYGIIIFIVINFIDPKYSKSIKNYINKTINNKHPNKIILKVKDDYINDPPYADNRSLYNIEGIIYNRSVYNDTNVGSRSLS
jgi:hypothetical protein